MPRARAARADFRVRIRLREPLLATISDPGDLPIKKYGSSACNGACFFYLPFSHLLPDQNFLVELPRRPKLLCHDCKKSVVISSPECVLPSPRLNCDTRLHPPLPPLFMHPAPPTAMSNLRSSGKSARVACRLMRAAVSNLRMGGAVAFVAAQGWMTGVSWSTRESSNGTVVWVAPVLGRRAATTPIRR